MSSQTNYGTIDLGKEITIKAIEAVKKEFEMPLYYDELIVLFEEGRTEIEFDEYYDKEFYGTCVQLVKALAPLGYVLNGAIKNYSDYGDGYTYIDDNVVSDACLEDTWRHDATDDDIIEVLRSRGYDVSALKKVG